MLFLRIRTTATLEINNTVNETMGITAQLKINATSNGIKHILSLLEYAGSSSVN
jgi:hypothetical protein